MNDTKIEIAYGNKFLLNHGDIIEAKKIIGKKEMNVFFYVEMNKRVKNHQHSGLKSIRP